MEGLKTEDRISQLLDSVAVWLKLWFDFRLLWFILFNFAIYYGYLLYTPFLDAWHNEPTVIATDQADFPVEKLPFPAITICSNNKIVYRQLESVLRTQPWKALKDFNYNITQKTTDKGMYRRSSLYMNFVSLGVCISKHIYSKNKCINLNQL